jgi:hypothetical protein
MLHTANKSVMTPRFRHPQVRYQSEDEQTKYKVENLKPIEMVDRRMRSRFFASIAIKQADTHHHKCVRASLRGAVHRASLSHPWLSTSMDVSIDQGKRVIGC